MIPANLISKLINTANAQQGIIGNRIFYYLCGTYFLVIGFSFFQFKLNGYFKTLVKETEIKDFLSNVFQPKRYLSKTSYGEYLMSFDLSEKIANDIATLVISVLTVVVAGSIAMIWISQIKNAGVIIIILSLCMILNVLISLITFKKIARRNNYENVVQKLRSKVQSNISLTIPFVNMLKLRKHLMDSLFVIEKRSLREAVKTLKLDTWVEFIYFSINNFCLVYCLFEILDMHKNKIISNGDAFAIFYVVSFAISHIKMFSTIPLLIVSIGQKIKLNQKIVPLCESASDSLSDDMSGVKINNLIIQNISFSWNKDKIFKLQDFALNSGERWIFSGENGSGKSTLLKSIAGLLDIEECRIILNGTYSNNKNLLKNKTTYISSHDRLFKGSVEENVCFFSKQLADIEKARQLLHIVDFYESLKISDKEFDFRLGPMGEGLSKGQQQRLLIARGLFENPEILILDEVTSGIDVISEKTIIKNITLSYPNLIILYVNHRKGLLSENFKVAHIVRGELVEAS